MIETIKRSMRAVQDKLRSYANQRQCEASFSVRDPIFLKVSPTKGNVRSMEA